jgi:NCS2 family nucleobase:cation symporter-2
VIDPVDERLPLTALLPLACQHVLVMYAGAIAVPLIVGRALGLPPDQVAFLISADLFACGLATIVQSAGFPGVGIRLPLMMGVTFAAVGPTISLAASPGIGLPGVYGAVIGAGIFGIAMAPFISRLLPLFPPVVTGTIILVTGMSLMPVAIEWAGGGAPSLTHLIGGTLVSVPNPDFAQLPGLGIALFVLLVVLALIKWGSNFMSSIAVLLGMCAGGGVAACLGMMHFEQVGAAAWFDVVIPCRFGMPQFHPVAVATMGIVMIVVMIESLGMFLALSDITGRKLDQAALTRGLRADGIGTLLGGIFNTFPYTSFSQNVGLVGITGVRSRWVTVAGGGIMVILGLLPKLSALVEAVPQVVLGGAGLVMFGMVAATGARILSGVNFRTGQHNLFIVAIALGFGMIPVVAPAFFQHLPSALLPLLQSGILLAALVSVMLNALFNGLAGRAAAHVQATAGHF